MSEENRQHLWNFFSCFFENELNETSERVEQPDWIQTTLLPHQKSAVAAALQLEAAKSGLDVGPLPGEEYGGKLYSHYGILGDRVGSGKSLIALALVKYPTPAPHSIEYTWRNFSGSYMDNYVGFLRTRPDPPTYRYIPLSLFILPHALIGQWEDYVRHDTKLKVFFVKKRKDACECNLETLVDQGYDAIMVSATMWRDFDSTHTTRTIIWPRIFIDEADSIMFPVATHDILNARFIWFISASWINLIFSQGSYMNLETTMSPPNTITPYIQSRMKRFANQQYFNVGGVRSPIIRRICGNVSIATYNIPSLTPVLFQSTRLLIHNSEDFIHTSFQVPDIHHVQILCLTPPNIQVLRSLISDDMMERLHAGDAGGVLEMLGMQSRTESEIIAAVNDTLEKELDTLRRTYEFKKTLDYVSDVAKAKALQGYEERLARLSSRISAIEDRIRNTQEQACPICFDTVTTPSITPCCRNVFCFACICNVLKRTNVCPLCRSTIDGIQSMQVLGNIPVAPSRIRTKQEEFRAFLRENPTARVLTFSSYDATFGGLSSLLETDGIPHATLTGSQARITKLIRQFGEGKYRVLFLNAKNMGAGLNIAAATHVLLYHRMSVETKNQIIGRAMRMGRTEPLQVLHLLHGNEMSASDRIEHV